MFGKREQSLEPTSARYRVEHFHSAGKHETLAAGLERMLNLGEDTGWRLITVTQHAGVILLYWDTGRTE